MRGPSAVVGGGGARVHFTLAKGIACSRQPTAFLDRGEDEEAARTEQMCWVAPRCGASKRARSCSKALPTSSCGRGTTHLALGAHELIQPLRQLSNAIVGMLPAGTPCERESARDAWRGGCDDAGFAARPWWAGRPGRDPAPCEAGSPPCRLRCLRSPIGAHP